MGCSGVRASSLLCNDKKEKVHANYHGVDQGDVGARRGRPEPLEAAVREAMRSSMTQRHGCVLVHNRRIVSAAHNDMPHRFRESVHAEVHALKKLKHRRPELLKRCVLYVIRIGPDSSGNALKYSKPCAACARFIRECGVRTVFYSTNREYDHYCTP